MYILLKFILNFYVNFYKVFGMHMNIKQEFEKIRSILISEVATIKLFIIRYGVCVDGEMLESLIPEYRYKFRVKRSMKKLTVHNMQVYDSIEHNVSYVPEEIFITIGESKSVVKLNYRTNSPFRLVFKNDRLCVECLDLDMFFDAELSQKSSISHMMLNGFTMDNYVQILGADRIGILGYDGCEEFYRNKACFFCDTNPFRQDERSARPSLNQLYKNYDGNIERWLNASRDYVVYCALAYRHLLQEHDIQPHLHLHLMAGNLADNNAEWNYMLELASALSKERSLQSVDSYLNIITPVDPRHLEEAREAGFRKLIFNLEVYGEDNFRRICSGKNSIVGYDVFIKRLLQGAKIFGPGNVISSFVLGAQPVGELMYGVEYLAKNGVSCDYTVFTPKKGTV